MWQSRGKIYADVVELVDSLDLGSNAQACRFESCHPHQSIQTRTFYRFVKGSGFLLIDKNVTVCIMKHIISEV